MRKVLQQLGKYKRDTFLCIGLTALEVIMEILMPFVTAIIIDRGLEQSNLSVVYRYGALMIVMAFLSLIFGAMAGKNAASAASVCLRICGRQSMPIFRPFPFPILTNSVCLDLLHV